MYLYKSTLNSNKHYNIGIYNNKKITFTSEWINIHVVLIFYLTSTLHNNIGIDQNIINAIYWGWIPFSISMSAAMQSVPIKTEVVSSNPPHGEVFLMQYYVIKFVSYLWQVSGFLQVLYFPPPIKLTSTI